MAVKFNGLTKHGRLQFAPGIAMSFADEHVEDYFTTMGWASPTKDKVEQGFAFPKGSVELDPLTVWADGPKKGQHVMPHLAAAHLKQEG